MANVMSSRAPGIWPVNLVLTRGSAKDEFPNMIKQEKTAAKAILMANLPAIGRFYPQPSQNKNT
jgi:hypothetical protein